MSFFDVNDEPINALDLMGKYCYTKAAIKIESIFIGSKIFNVNFTTAPLRRLCLRRLYVLESLWL